MKQLDTDALVGEMINNQHVVEALPAVDLSASQPLQPAQNVFDDAAAQRHGRIAAKSFGIGYRGLVKEDLDTDIKDTIGDAMGEVFGAASRAGNRLFYWLILLGVLAPLIAVMATKAMATLNEGDKGNA